MTANSLQAWAAKPTGRLLILRKFPLRISPRIATARRILRPAVSVVIPAKEASSERLGRCLEALGAQTVQPAEVVVVVPRRVPIADGQARWPWVRFLRCPNPPSFCRAVNAGIAATQAPWVLLLNDDVVMEPDFVERLLGGAHNDA